MTRFLMTSYAHISVKQKDIKSQSRLTSQTTSFQLPHVELSLSHGSPRLGFIRRHVLLRYEDDP